MNLSDVSEQEFIPEFPKIKKPIRKKIKIQKTVDEKKLPKKRKKETKGFIYKGYGLFEKEIKTPSGKKRIIRFFSKTKPKMAKPIEIPKGFKMSINKKTGVPYLKKKK